MFGSPVPASKTCGLPGCTVMAPMDSDGMDVKELAKTGRSSVSGIKLTLLASPAAALVLFHTPPPVAPRYTVLPEEMLGSTAIELIRPVTSP